MNLNFNYINNVCMDPMAGIYVKVINSVQQCAIFFTLNYFYDGKWIKKSSSIFSSGVSRKLFFEKSGSNRDFTIFKRTPDKDILIFNTLLSQDVSVCYEVTGTSAHTFINKVPC